MANFTLTTGVDTFTGFGQDNDIFSGPGGGSDSLNGAGGNDTFIIDGNQIGSIVGGAGNDTLMMSFTGPNNALNQSLSITGVETLIAETTNFYATTQQLNGFSTITPGAGGSDFSLFLQGAGGTLNLASKFMSAATLHIDASLATSAVNLTGSSHVDYLIGSQFNDTLNAAGGADNLTGGAGNDKYFVHSLASQVTEAIGGGNDTVLTSTNYTLQAGSSVDLLTMIDPTLTTGVKLVGNELGQTIRGGAGADYIIGGGGADSLYGGGGYDRFVVDSADDRVFEAPGQGSGEVFTSVSYALSNGQSIATLATLSPGDTTPLVLVGNEQDQYIYGNNGDNGLYGGDGNDVLLAGGGNDRLGGGYGADLLDGGLGNDVFIYGAVGQSTGSSCDVIGKMNLSGVDKFQFGFKPLGIDAEVTTGKLDYQTFDQDVSAAIGPNQLAAHHAVLFAPDSGNQMNELVLFVDVNGQDGYQSGQDYAIQLNSSTGPLTLDDFI